MTDVHRMPAFDGKNWERWTADENIHGKHAGHRALSVSTCSQAWAYLCSNDILELQLKTQGRRENQAGMKPLEITVLCCFIRKHLPTSHLCSVVWVQWCQWGQLPTGREVGLWSSSYSPPPEIWRSLAPPSLLLKPKCCLPQAFPQAWEGLKMSDAGQRLCAHRFPWGWHLSMLFPQVWGECGVLCVDV